MKLSDDKTILLKVGSNDLINGTFIIPEGVTTIGGCAFGSCSTLTQVIIPKGVTRIDVFAFMDCSALTQVIIPEEVKTIGINTFLNCSSLTQITIPDGVTSIGDGAFANCSALIHVTIPEEIERIGVFVFEGCNNLQVIAVNTHDDLALERIRNLLQAEHRAQAIKKSLYDEIIHFQQAAYQSMLHDPSISALTEYYLFFQEKIVLDMFVLIAGYEACAYQNFKKKAEGLSFPLTEVAFQQYKHDFNAIFGLSLSEEPSQPQENSNHLLEPRLLCIDQLRKYVGFIHQQQKIKQERHPDFFTENKAMLLGINHQLDAIEKAVTFLRSGCESGVQFTQADIAILGQGFIGKTLGRLINRLPLEPVQPAVCFSS